jgi:hypothetical protein
MNLYSFIQYRKEMNLPDGIYNALYNKEPSVIRVKDGIPVYVSFIGFIKNDEPRPSSIFSEKGVLHSSVELLLPAQKI